jgi:hypothetical protein
MAPAFLICLASAISMEGKPGAVNLLLRDSRAPDAVWNLRIPETVHEDAGFVALSTPPSGVEWRRFGPLIGYDLEVPRATPDLSYMARQKPPRTVALPGSYRVAVRCEAESEGVRFNIRLTNTSTRHWRRAFVHLCLSHRDAPGFARTAAVWLKTAAGLSSGTQWKRSPGLYAAFALLLFRDSETGDPFYTDYIRAEGNPRARGRYVFGCDPARPMCAGIAAVCPLFFMNNQANPCTDVALEFGDLAAGQTGEGSGRVYILTGGPAEFVRRVERDYPQE